MALYCTKQLKTCPGVISAWSKAASSCPLYALSLSSNAVGIYKEEGTPLVPDNEALIKNIRGSGAVQLAWHPHLMLLTIGWKDGAISFWNADERRLNEDSKVHRCSLVYVSWSPDGELLATVDEKGKVSLWNHDENHRPIPVASFTESGQKVSCGIWGDSMDGTCTEDPSPLFYYAVSSEAKNTVVCVNSKENREEIFDTSDTVHSLFVYPEKDQLVVVMSNCILMTYAKDEKGGYQKISKMKFATGLGETACQLKVAWSCPHTLASVSDNDAAVRMYNFDTEDNYMLPIEGDDATQTSICCLKFDQRFGVLAAGTTAGKVCIYRYMGDGTSAGDGDEDSDPSLSWECLGTCILPGAPTRIEFGPTTRLFHIHNREGITLCTQVVLQSRTRDNMAAVQVEAGRVLLETLEGGVVRDVSSDMQILGLDVDKDHLMLWDGKQTEVYAVGGAHSLHMSSKFQSKGVSLALHMDSIYQTSSNCVEVCNMAGTVKQTIYFDSEDGSPTHVDVNQDYLGVITDHYFVRVYKLGGREAKPCCLSQMLQLGDLDDPLEGVVSIRINCKGNMISILGSGRDKESRDTRMLVHDIDACCTIVRDFANESRSPESHYWDNTDPRLLVVQTTLLAGTLTSRGPLHHSGGVCIEAVTLFASQEHGLLVHDFQALEPNNALIGLSSPDLLIFQRDSVESNSEDRTQPSHKKLPMRCFEGIGGIDGKTKSALLDFSFHLAVGALDEAVKSIQMIHSPKLWENMAQMCIKSGRIDVAELCMANMEHYLGNRALRESQNLDPDVRVANVAIHMDMVDDAKRMLHKGKHFDRLNSLYQACGMWDKAKEVAEKHDRIHLRSTHFQMGRHFEMMGDYRAAVREFEKAGTSKAEVPRMMFTAGKLEELERYIMQSGDHELLLWWGRYCESCGNLPVAIKCYKQSENNLALVRALSFQGQFEEAEMVVKDSKDRAATFFLAQQYEAQDLISDAVRCFAEADCPHHGVRLARQHGMHSDLLRFALMSSEAAMLETAEYFEGEEEWDKAAMLYNKGGKAKKAMEICLAGQLFDSLQKILCDVDSHGDPELVVDAAAVLLQHGEFEKASKMLLKAGQEQKALDLCLEHNVTITEDMAEAMTPSETPHNAHERNNIILKIAKACKHQGSFHVAAKKYAQAGERIRAIKALVKSGDNSRIIMFATRSRQREVYMMAANYLQTVDWHSQPEIMKSIIQFYTKAKAYESLVAFFEVCAQIEIDEYRDYDKGLQAVRKALSYGEKSQSVSMEMRLASLKQRLECIETFVDARHTISEDPQAAIDMCQGLLDKIGDHQAAEAGVRMGDVYALMVEYWFEKGEMENSFQLLEEMRSRNIVLTPYIDRIMLEAILKAVGMETEFRPTTEDDVVEENVIDSDSGLTD